MTTPTPPTLDPSASPHNVPLSAGEDAFLLALAGSLSDLRLGAVLVTADLAFNTASVANLPGHLRHAFDRCYEMAVPVLHLTPVASPNSARRRLWWEIGAVWALEQTTDPTSAADRGHEFRRMVATAERDWAPERLRARAERLMDRIAETGGYRTERLTAARLDALETALGPLERAAAALVSDATVGERP